MKPFRLLFPLFVVPIEVNDRKFGIRARYRGGAAAVQRG